MPPVDRYSGQPDMVGAGQGLLFSAWRARCSTDQQSAGDCTPESAVPLANSGGGLSSAISKTSTTCS